MNFIMQLITLNSFNGVRCFVLLFMARANQLNLLLNLYSTENATFFYVNACCSHWIRLTVRSTYIVHFISLSSSIIYEEFTHANYKFKRWTNAMKMQIGWKLFDEIVDSDSSEKDQVVWENNKCRQWDH